MSDTDHAYRMTYKLTTGPGKRRSEIGKDEGACDHLLMVSILGTGMHGWDAATPDICGIAVLAAGFAAAVTVWCR